MIQEREIFLQHDDNFNCSEELVTENWNQTQTLCIKEAKSLFVQQLPKWSERQKQPTLHAVRTSDAHTVHPLNMNSDLYVSDRTSKHENKHFELCFSSNINNFTRQQNKFILMKFCEKREIQNVGSLVYFLIWPHRAHVVCNIYIFYSCISYGKCLVKRCCSEVHFSCVSLFPNKISPLVWLILFYQILEINSPGWLHDEKIKEHYSWFLG